MDFDERLEELFIDLTEAAPEQGGVVHAVKTGHLVFVSGKLPRAEGRLTYKGRLGLDVTLDHGKAAARAAMVQSLSALWHFLGGTLNKVKRIVAVRGFVASGADFKDHHKVFELASRLLVDIFGTAGQHSLTAVGVNNLPNGAAVEIELIVEVK